MPTLILVRHGRSTANTRGVLAGWTPGVALDERGAAQAAALPGRLAGLPLAAAVTSPLQRCRETLAPLLAARPRLPLHTDERIGECRYGDWSGRKLAELAGEPLWETVQRHPSAAAFPGGESVRAMQTRAVDAVREWNARVEAEHGEDALYLMCSHGDVVKAVVADALGLHLDHFQRITADPCSVTAVRYTRLRPYVLRLGDTGDLAGLAPHEEPSGSGDKGDAAVGGGAGAP
ncbi:phosphoglycerate mutase [Streptomyces cinnamoneus]|uniref:Phosphoglycerate mutase n=1 Tax=Streptomyces cinnamoneus TaxID=53446 RepID=A0A2G1XBC3_STRCJ|nr:histidine phosphatase family protein [Streptomyces cinnamoneus]PHQ48501.1 phosphoglycerate mutase [Streptomyces cinnamoneus]PPT12500.1 phosphoglycerate mutase [Streptomyces cinnamoneus]